MIDVWMWTLKSHLQGNAKVSSQLNTTHLMTNTPSLLGFLVEKDWFSPGGTGFCAVPLWRFCHGSFSQEKPTWHRQLQTASAATVNRTFMFDTIVALYTNETNVLQCDSLLHHTHSWLLACSCHTSTMVSLPFIFWVWSKQMMVAMMLICLLLLQKCLISQFPNIFEQYSIAVFCFRSLRVASKVPFPVRHLQCRCDRILCILLCRMATLDAFAHSSHILMEVEEG